MVAPPHGLLPKAIWPHPIKAHSLDECDAGLGLDQPHFPEARELL
jgi:hypothetical protein